LLSQDAVPAVQTNAVKYFCGLGYDPDFAEKNLTILARLDLQVVPKN